LGKHFPILENGWRWLKVARREKAARQKYPFCLSSATSPPARSLGLIFLCFGLCALLSQAREPWLCTKLASVQHFLACVSPQIPDLADESRGKGHSRIFREGVAQI